MKKRFRIILSIVLPIICIASVCMSFFMPKTKADENVNNVVQQTTAEDTVASSAGKDQKGGAVYIENGATYVMRGGTIKNVFNVYGGAIYIADGATFTMEAGTITGCQALYGGAIYVASGGTCNINGGTITGNKAENAPAIYVETGATLNVNSDVEITDNIFAYYLPISFYTLETGVDGSGLNLHYMNFGSYPQTYVGDNMNEALEQWYSISSPTGIATYTSGIPNETENTSIYVSLRSEYKEWISYQYIDGNIYARGTSRRFSATGTYKNGTTIKETGTVVWFKVEPIKWLVLNYEAYMSGNDEVIDVISEQALASQIPYVRTLSASCEWETSFLRSWLNDNFYSTAFNDVEKRYIKQSLVKNNVVGDYASETSDGTGVDTYDYIYTKSYYELSDSAGVFTNNNARVCGVSDYSLSNYCFWIDKSTRQGNACYYWTRSIGSIGELAYYVRHDGIFSDSNGGRTTRNGVRPAMQLGGYDRNN